MTQGLIPDQRKPETTLTRLSRLMGCGHLGPYYFEPGTETPLHRRSCILCCCDPFLAAWSCLETGGDPFFRQLRDWRLF